MQTFEFEFTLGGITRITTQLENALYEGKCDDCLIWSRGGVVHLSFHREAESMAKAIESAKADVENAIPALSVVAVEEGPFA
jgi:hypothetical protein